MAALAALALGVTVITSQRALSEVSEVVIRGEGDLLLAALSSDLADEPVPIPKEALERALEAHRDDGLRYIALVDREGNPVVHAGHPEIAAAMHRPGEVKIEGRRARISGMLAPPRRGVRVPPPTGPFFAARPLPPLLVFELEPPVIETLRRDLRRIAVVGAAAAAVLLAFAVAWARSARRLAELERRAAREQRLVALGSMSSVMAHELRNPLASLKGHAQLLAEDLEDAGDDKRHAKAERVVAEAERLEQLTTTLLDFVRDGPIERTRVSPAEIVDRALMDLGRDRVQVDLAAAPAMLEVDATRLARAIHNLVDNALQAAPDGAVELAFARDGGDTILTVRDHGPGLPPGGEAQIFEPFVTTRVRGTGLGLAVARRIAEQHGGTLTAANHRSGGAVFTLRLPGRDA